MVTATKKIERTIEHGVANGKLVHLVRRNSHMADDPGRVVEGSSRCTYTYIFFIHGITRLRTAPQCV